eukprot:1413819-Rhodomonas_salina.1
MAQTRTPRNARFLLRLYEVCPLLSLPPPLAGASPEITPSPLLSLPLSSAELRVTVASPGTSTQELAQIVKKARTP